MRTTTRFSVPGISCDHCQESIEGAVAPTEGVQRVEVDIAARTVMVEHDPGLVDQARLVGLIEDQGYDVESTEEVG
ncbi:MAG TPA: cation transporter [Actinomycetota bacterium]